mmetsp:Transcript_8610/g.10875  ORF Transcript_8610/g.10875 Transcript_8610/m.10875 type:complete len:163 (+) Transcript_8610:331-819(+)
MNMDEIHTIEVISHQYFVPERRAIQPTTSGRQMKTKTEIQSTNTLSQLKTVLINFDPFHVSMQNVLANVIVCDIPWRKIGIANIVPMTAKVLKEPWEVRPVSIARPKNRNRTTWMQNTNKTPVIRTVTKVYAALMRNKPGVPVDTCLATKKSSSSPFCKTNC